MQSPKHRVKTQKKPVQATRNHKGKKLEALEQYHRLIDLSPEAIAIHTSGTIVYLNNVAAKLIGASSPRTLIGKSIMQFVHPDYVDIVKKRVKHVYSKKRPTDLIEEKFVRLDGGVIDVEVISMPITYNGEDSVQLIIRDITEKKRAKKRIEFLEKINESLFTSLDKMVTLQKVAKLIVPELADYCRIVILNDDKEIREIAVNHRDPKSTKLATELYETYKDREQNTHGVQRILQSGKAEMISHVDKKIIDSVRDNPKMVKIIQEIGLKSYMGVPLIARKKVIGAMTFSSVIPHRFYTKEDLSFARDVGNRIAIALDNAQLYHDMQKELRERRLVEEKLMKHQERLDISHEAARIGTFDWNMNTNDVFWSPEIERLFGVPPGTFGKKFRGWEKAIYKEDQLRLQREIEKAVKGHEPFYAEFRVVYPDKSIHYLASRGKIFYDEKGKPERMLGISMDIDQRKQSENNAKFLAEASRVLASSLDYQTTLNSVAQLAVPVIADWCTVSLIDESQKPQQLAVAHKDPKKVKWAINYAKENPTDMNAPSGFGKVVRTGKPEIYSEITDAMLQAAAKTKKNLRIIRNLGFTSAMIVPLFSQKKVIGAITFVTTESRKKYSLSDLRMAEELAHRASLAIENARLYRGSQAAITLRDDFISVASHELKTPITSVKIFTQILRQHAEKSEDSKTEEYLEKMERQLNKLTDLIYNLLNIAKIQTGRMEYKEKLFEFDKMILDVIDVMQQTSNKHRLIVQGKTGKNVFGDEDRLGQVVSNLISNAIKYSPSADRVLVKLQAKNGHVVVAVQDFGIGINRPHLEKIFERFYRVYDTTDKTFPGLGIGLYIAHEIVRRHMGKLWVESETGKGSTFYFSIPVGMKRAD